MQHFFLYSSQPAGRWLETRLLLGTSSHLRLSPCSKTLLTPVTWAMNHESNASKSVLSNFTVLQSYLKACQMLLLRVIRRFELEDGIGEWEFAFLTISQVLHMLGVTVWKLIYLMVKRKLVLPEFPCLHMMLNCIMLIAYPLLKCHYSVISFFHLSIRIKEEK